MFMFINITNIKHKHKHKHYKLGQGAAYLSALSGDHIVNITFMFINIIIQHYKHKHKHKHYNSGKELLIIQHLMEVIMSFSPSVALLSSGKLKNFVDMYII